MVKIHHTTRTSLSVRTDTPNRCEKTSVEMFLNGRNRAFDTTHSRTIVISDSIKYRNNLNITKPLFDRVREGGGLLQNIAWDYPLCGRIYPYGRLCLSWFVIQLIPSTSFFALLPRSNSFDLLYTLGLKSTSHSRPSSSFSLRMGSLMRAS